MVDNSVQFNNEEVQEIQQFKVHLMGTKILLSKVLTMVCNTHYH
jgi:hypothetical protein